MQDLALTICFKVGRHPRHSIRSLCAVLTTLGCETRIQKQFLHFAIQYLCAPYLVHLNALQYKRTFRVLHQHILSTQSSASTYLSGSTAEYLVPPANARPNLVVLRLRVARRIELGLCDSECISPVFTQDVNRQRARNLREMRAESHRTRRHTVDVCAR